MAFTTHNTPITWGYDVPRATVADRACQSVATPIEIDLTSDYAAGALTAAGYVSPSLSIDFTNTSTSTTATWSVAPDYVTTNTLRYEPTYTYPDYRTSDTLRYEPTKEILEESLWNILFKDHKKAKVEDMEDSKLNRDELAKSFDELMK